MQVFKITPTTPYTYGAAIIAARDSDEAIKAYCDDEFCEDRYYDFCCTCNIIVGLDYKTDKPVLIFDTISSE